MIPKDQPSRIPLDRWEIFLRALRDQVAQASEEYPTVRCWKRSTLRKTITRVIQANRPQLFSTFPVATTVLNHLGKIGWIHPIKVQSPAGMSPVEFILMDMEATENHPIDPLELLQAFLPDGVVCYFGALAYHELSNQDPTHYHIARLNPPRLKTDTADIPVSDEPPKEEPLKRNPLGTEAFQFEGAAYYLTRRDASLLPGIQMRVVSPRTWLRITTVEQTLIDTLIHPVQCGGEAVVLESWETGIEAMDQDRMADHLEKINREDLDRRVGAAWEMMGTEMPKGALGKRLETLKSRLKATASDIQEIPLLTGFEFANSNPVWKVRIP